MFSEIEINLLSLLLFQGANFKAYNQRPLEAVAFTTQANSNKLKKSTLQNVYASHHHSYHILVTHYTHLLNIKYQTSPHPHHSTTPPQGYLSAPSSHYHQSLLPHHRHYHYHSQWLSTSYPLSYYSSSHLHPHY